MKTRPTHAGEFFIAALLGTFKKLRILARCGLQLLRTELLKSDKGVRDISIVDQAGPQQYRKFLVRELTLKVMDLIVEAEFY